MEYRIVSGDSNFDLVKAVNTLIIQGFHPLGGPYVVPIDDDNFVNFTENDGYGIVCQAMIKED